MSLLDLSAPRLEKAIQRYVKESKARKRWRDEGPQFTVLELLDALLRRGMSERDVHSLFNGITAKLEPQGCEMTHCKNFGGSGAPMNCCLERMPSRCSILKEYRLRKIEREAKKVASEVSA